MVGTTSTQGSEWHALEQVAGGTQVHEGVADLVDLGQRHRKVVPALRLQPPIAHLRGQNQRVAEASDREGVVLDTLRAGRTRHNVDVRLC